VVSTDSSVSHSIGILDERTKQLNNRINELFDKVDALEDKINQIQDSSFTTEDRERMDGMVQALKGMRRRVSNLKEELESK